MAQPANHWSGIVGILLAAGRARRFGADKLLHALADGTPMALAAVEPLLAGCDQVVAVLRPAQHALAELLARRGVRLVLTDEAERGMGHSLAAGVRAAANARGWVVALGDMPYVRRDTVAAVASALRDGASLAAPEYAGQRGHPVGFAGEWREQLLELNGDIGARPIIEWHLELLRRLPVDDPGVLHDIDTPIAATPPPAGAATPAPPG